MCTSRHHSKNFWRSGKVFDLVDILESGACRPMQSSNLLSNTEVHAAHKMSFGDT